MTDKVFDTFLYTRSRQEDYKWWFRPAYLSRDFDEKVKPLFQMRQMSSQAEFFEKEGRRNIYFFIGDTYLAIGCMYISEQKDMFGRNIARMEGVTCPLEEWSDLMDFLPMFFWMMLNPDNEIGLRVFFSKTYEVEEHLTIKNYRTKIFNVPIEDIAEDMKDWGYSDFVLKFHKNLRETDHLFEFIIGTREFSFYPYHPEAFYHLYNRELNNSVMRTDYIEPSLWEDCNLNCCLTVDKNNYYRIDTIAESVKGQVVGYCEDCGAKDGSKESDGWNDLIYLDELNAFKIGWNRLLQTRGYHLIGTEPGNSNIPMVPFGTKTNNYGVTYECFRLSKLKIKEFMTRSMKKRHEQAIAQLLFNSTRFHGYYSGSAWDGGCETVYLIKTELGLWIFWFGLDKAPGVRDSIYAEGLLFRGREQMKGWMNLEGILLPYLKKHISINSSFWKQWECFLKNKGLTTYSCVISAVIPEVYIPEMNFHKCFVPVENDGFKEKEKLGSKFCLGKDDCNQRIEKIRKERQRFQKDKWYLYYYVEEPAATDRPQEDVDYCLYEKKEELASIDNEGEFLFHELEAEVQQLIKDRGGESLAQCHYCKKWDVDVNINLERDNQCIKTCRKCKRSVTYRVIRKWKSNN